MAKLETESLKDDGFSPVFPLPEEIFRNLPRAPITRDLTDVEGVIAEVYTRKERLKVIFGRFDEPLGRIATRPTYHVAVYIDTTADPLAEEPYVNVRTATFEDGERVLAGVEKKLNDEGF